MSHTLGSTKAQRFKSTSGERIWVFKWCGKWHVWCDGCIQFAKCRTEGCTEDYGWPTHEIAMMLANEHLKVWHS